MRIRTRPLKHLNDCNVDMVLLLQKSQAVYFKVSQHPSLKRLCVT